MRSASPNASPAGGFQASVVPFDMIALWAAGVVTAGTHQCPLTAGVFGPQLAAYRYLCARCSRQRECMHGGITGSIAASRYVRSGVSGAPRWPPALTTSPTRTVIL